MSTPTFDLQWFVNIFKLREIDGSCFSTLFTYQGASVTVFSIYFLDVHSDISFPEVTISQVLHAGYCILHVPLVTLCTNYGLTPVAPLSCSTWQSIAITNCRGCVHLPMQETSVICSIDPECLYANRTNGTTQDLFGHCREKLKHSVAQSLLMDHSSPCCIDGQSMRTQAAALDCADELTTLWRERGMARHNISLAQQALNASAQPKSFWKSCRASNRRETLASPYWHHAGRVPESHAPRSDGWKRIPT